MFKEILGQLTAKDYLKKAIEEDRLPNTLLFTGPDGVGKKKTALALAAHLLQTSLARLEANNHSDLHLLTPEGKVGLHSIETIRKAIDVSHSAPFEAPAKIFIIDLAERMQPAAANAMLKTLEEPVLDSYWILISSKPKEILSTILSRCVKVTFQPLTTVQVSSILEKLGHSTDVAKLACGSIAKALELYANPGVVEAQKILLSLLSEKPDYPQLFSALEQIEQLVESEDSLTYQTNVSSLFTTITLYLRDQALISNREWMETLEEARLAFERNMKLSTCLEFFLLKKNFTIY